MTAPRLARATRSRFFVGIAALLLMVGFVAIFHSSQQQLDKSREMMIRCEQQQEALNSRMQAIVEHKFRLEKLLESERKEQTEAKYRYEQKLKEERDIHAKASQDSNIRFESLQQHYKLQQSEHADLVEDCSKTKKSQLEQINGLERKVKSLGTLLAQAKSQHNKDVEHWMVKYKHLESENERLNALLKSTDDQVRNKLMKQIEDFKMNCAYRPPHVESTENSVLPQPNPLKSASMLRDFKEQIAVSENLYKIPIKVRNITSRVHETNNKTAGDGMHLTNLGNIRSRNGQVINSVENFQIIPKPLVNDDKQNQQPDDVNKDSMQQPPPLKVPFKSSTSPSDSKTSENNKQAVPAASSTSEKTKRSSTLANNSQRLKSKQLPLGVAPVPDNFEELIKNDEKNDSGNNNNRYANVIEGLSAKNEDAEQENGAHEVKDNDFNLVDDKNDGKDHLLEVLDNVNNAAEEDTNNIDGKQGDVGHMIGDGVLVAPNQNLLDEVKKERNGANDDIDIVENNKNSLRRDEDDKLKNEVDGDEGKEIPVRHDVHDEQNEEEGDDDEYPNNARQQEGEAVRN